MIRKVTVMTTVTLTLNEIRAFHPCASGWVTLLSAQGKTRADDVLFPLESIIDSNGLDDALWCLRVRPELSPLWRRYAVWCARRVQHLMTDARSLAALDVSERHALGTATDDELAAALAAARAAEAAAWAAALAAARAADAAAWAAAWGDARDAAWYAQENKLRQILRAGEWRNDQQEVEK